MIKNQYDLESAALDIALMALAEAKEYGSDPYEIIHQMVDGHECVIYTYKAAILCTECNRENGEEQLDEIDFKAKSFNEYVTKLAYAILLDEACKQYGEL
tara:strand:- start:664 stop:963 length:300 start_codon:yes stop_codon:yes gene_type:complete